MTIHATLIATKFMGSKLTLPKDWCTALDMDRYVCESISNEILDLYEMGNRDVYENIADLSALHGWGNSRYLYVITSMHLAQRQTQLKKMSKKYSK